MIEPQIYNIYYDEEGDFLDITFGETPDQGYSQDIESGIFIHKEEATDRIYGIGILGFKERAPQILKEVLQKMNIRLPLKILFSP